MRQVWGGDEPADEQRLTDREVRSSPVLRAISDSAVVTSDDGYYHILNTDETGVYAQQLQSSVAADRGGERISRVEAERRGFQPCECCLTY